MTKQVGRHSPKLVLTNLPQICEELQHGNLELHVRGTSYGDSDMREEGGDRADIAPDCTSLGRVSSLIEINLPHESEHHSLRRQTDRRGC